MSYEVKSPIPVIEGGLGVSSPTNHGLIIGNGTSAVSSMSTGTIGQIITSNTPSAPTFQNAVSNVVVTSYTSGSGNHVLNGSTTTVEVICFGAGGGGGSGRSGTTALSAGGSGGAGGGIGYTFIPVAFFGGAGATVAYSVGSAGTGGTGASSANGNPGIVGGDTQFGTITALGGTPGIGGTTTTVVGPDNVISTWNNSYQSLILTAAGSGTVSVGGSATDIAGMGSPTSGGGGGGGNSTTSRAGGAGGKIRNSAGTNIFAGAIGGTATTALNCDGANGSSMIASPYAKSLLGGNGGGGGGHNNGGTSGKGGNGGFPGGGGGAGSGTVSPGTSGVGGNGGNGAIWVIEYL